MWCNKDSKDTIIATENHHQQLEKICYQPLRSLLTMEIKKEETSANPRTCSLEDVSLELDESLKVLSASVLLLSLMSASSLSLSRR